MSPLPDFLLDVARNPVLAGVFIVISDVYGTDAGKVGLPIGLGAISGIITGKTSRSNWYTVSTSLSGRLTRCSSSRPCLLPQEIHLGRSSDQSGPSFTD